MRRFGVSKYKNKPCVVNGIKFQSTKESKRYLDLLKMEKAGLISNLKMQHRFKVIGSQSYECPETGVIIKERPTYYKADFSYTNEHGRLVVEDVKGMKKGVAYDLFSVKRKLMLQEHKIHVVEL